MSNMDTFIHYLLFYDPEEEEKWKSNLGDSLLNRIEKRHRKCNDFIELQRRPDYCKCK